MARIGDTLDRHFRMKYEQGIEDGGERRGDSEGGGKNAGVDTEGRRDDVSEVTVGAESAPRSQGGDTTPRRRTASSSDSGTHHRADEETRDSSRGGNEG